MTTYVYQIYFPANGKCYIGVTSYLENRMFRHLRSGSLVCKALYKYADWQVSILHTCKSRDEANRIEIEEIRNFNSVAPNGYNLTRGGEGGDTFSDSLNKEVTRKRMSEVRRGVKKPALSKALIGNQYAKGKNLGNQFAKEANIGNQHSRGRKRTAETKLKMRISQIKRRLRELT